MPHINYKRYKSEITQHIDFLESQEQSLITKNLCQQKSREIDRFFDSLAPTGPTKITFLV